MTNHNNILLGSDFMLSVDEANFQDNMELYMDKVIDSNETIIVTRKNNKNVVMISEETYNDMMESIHHYGEK